MQCGYNTDSSALVSYVRKDQKFDENYDQEILTLAIEIPSQWHWTGANTNA